MSKSIILWGATGQAKVLKECLQYHKKMKIVALFDNNQQVISPWSEIPIFYGKNGFVNWWENYQNYHKEKVFYLVAIGGNKGKDRLEIQEYLSSYQLSPMIAQHPTAFVAKNAQIGLGSQILANSSICAETIIGRSCIINTGAIVDHESILNDGVHICPGANLAGCVHIGAYTMIGTGAIILPRINIGKSCIIGAGAVVTKDVPDYTVVVGNPAKFLRSSKQEND